MIHSYPFFKQALGEAIPNRLIDKIYIDAVKVIDDEKVQKIHIVYNFVGEIAN